MYHIILRQIYGFKKLRTTYNWFVKNGFVTLNQYFGHLANYPTVIFNIDV